MVIGITGATGFIGRHVIARLRARGDECVAFSRRPEQPVHGCRETRIFAPDRPLDLTRLDAVVNLAGESIIGLWTQAKRSRILASRVATTERIVKTLIESPGAPVVLVNASAIGFYGDRREEILPESAAPGTGFISEVAQKWELATDAGTDMGLRVARVRIGFVLGRDGGALPMLRRIFRLGLGGKLGSGQQWMSLVHVDDVAGLFVFLLDDLLQDGGKASGGAFNAVAPQPVRNADFTRAVGQVLHRPAILPVPEIALRTLLGEMSQLMLMSERVVPERTLEIGYRFKYPMLDQMLGEACG